MFDKNIILFVNTNNFHVTQETIKSLSVYAKHHELKFRYAVIYNPKFEKIDQDKFFADSGVDIVIPCDFNDALQIESALSQYKEEVAAITVRAPESNIPDFSKIIPHLPYVKTPTTESLIWATDKIKMRQQLSIYDKDLVPYFSIVKNTTKKTLKELKDTVGYPMVVKPANLTLSLLVNLCFHQEDLESNIQKAFKKIKRIYKENGRTSEPEILVERFMEGDMYSIDAYVDDVGNVSFCPLVYIETGRSVGFDDFFGYKMISPTILNAPSIQAAEEAAKKSIHALGLRNTTAHIEFIKSDDTWQVLELGPRIGGFRHRMHKLTHGIDHQLNDVLIRLGKKTLLPKKLKGYSAGMKFFAPKEGVITEIKGIKAMKELPSFKEIRQRLKVGDRAVFAKNGGKAVFEILLFNKDRSDLLADIRRIEQAVKINTTRSKKV